MSQAVAKGHAFVRAEHPDLWTRARVVTTVRRKTKIFGIPFFMPMKETT